MTAQTDETPQTATKANWKKARTHSGVTLPSGAVVAISLPNLATLIESGDLPNELLEDALAMRNKREITRESLLKSWEYAKFIVPRTVAEPKITADDVDDLPIQDVELVAAFASRITDMDAVGHQLGGLETVKSFREARGLVGLDEIVAGIEGG